MTCGAFYLNIFIYSVISECNGLLFRCGGTLGTSTEGLMGQNLTSCGSGSGIGTSYFEIGRGTKDRSVQFSE